VGLFSYSVNWHYP